MVDPLQTLDSKKNPVEELDFSYQNIPLNWDLLIQKKIGEGGMGAIYQGVIVGDGTTKKVVVKVSKRPQEHIQDLRTEVHLATQLKNNYIATTYPFKIYDEKGMIIMDFIEGHTLDQVRKKHNALGLRFPEKFAGLVGWLAAEALHYAHNVPLQNLEGKLVCGVLHRDITTRNIMIETEQGNTVIIDYGLGILRTDSAQTIGQISGTLGFVSPQIFKGEGAQVQDDMYGLCMTLYTLISGDNPIVPEKSKATPAEIMRNYQKEIPSLTQIMPHTNPQFSQILQRGTAIQREERYPDAATLYTDLKDFLFTQGFGPIRHSLRSYMELIYHPEFPHYLDNIRGQIAPNPSVPFLKKLEEVKVQTKDYMQKDDQLALETREAPGYILIG